MSNDKICNQPDCEEKATHRYTWPGESEVYHCSEHAAEAQKVASAIGVHLQIIPLPQPAEPQVCKWVSSGVTDWDSACGCTYFVEYGYVPSEKDFRFCPNCARPVIANY